MSFMVMFKRPPRSIAMSLEEFDSREQAERALRKYSHPEDFEVVELNEEVEVAKPIKENK